MAEVYDFLLVDPTKSLKKGSLWECQSCHCLTTNPQKHWEEIHLDPPKPPNLAKVER